MKVLFLDLDGVLCTDKSVADFKLPFPPDFYIPFRMGWDRLDKECIARLNKIIETTEARIVVSSSWRIKCDTDQKFEYIINYLHSEGVKADIFDRTPTHYIQKLSSSKERINNRRSEIQQWLNDWAGELIESFVILDDDSDMGNLSGSHVCPEEPIGIQDCDVKKAIKILNE